MKNILTITTIALFASCNLQETKEMKTEITPPIAKKQAEELTIHGDTRIDNYFWMRLSDAQKEADSADAQTQDVLDYLNTENEYMKSKMAHTETFQKNLFEEMKGRIKEDDESVPYKKNGYYYITKYQKGGDYPIHSRKKETLEAEEEILLNVNELAKDYDYYATGGLSISPNNKVLVFGEDVVSRRQYKLRFKNLETGEYYNDEIEGTTGGASWANDNKTVFYTKQDPQTLRSFQIYKHIIGTPISDDKLVYQEDDEMYNAFVYRVKSGKFLIVGSSSTMADEIRYLSTDNPDGEFKIFAPRERGVEYGISHFEDKFYIMTNWNAKNFRLMSCDLENTTKENWKEEIAHREETLLEGIEIFKNFMVVEERTKGLINLRIINKKDETEHYLQFDEAAYTAGTSVNLDFDSETLRYSYTSLTTPSSTIDYNMETKEKTVLKEQEVLGGKFDKENYTSERIFATAPDGVKVPISLVYRKDIDRSKTNPLLLYGYGSYGASMDVYFSTVRLSLLDRGFVYAIAHIRGGEDLGRQWYEDGKLLKKKNTFTDFIACGDHLVSENYTDTSKLFAMGGSAGGLLMGAVINMKPELWKGVVASVPFVDVVSTMLDETIPLTTGEFDEWGNPKDKEYYDYIKSYSPYDNIEAKAYPNLLITTGYWDSQVQYWEPAKWIAKLRDMKTDNNLLLMDCNMKVGHGGASGRFESLKEVALDYAFILDLVDIKK